MILANRSVILLKIKEFKWAVQDLTLAIKTGKYPSENRYKLHQRLSKAYEYLENNVFQMKSDVWSYGVVIWEIFSLAEEPYGDLTYSEVFDDLKNGRYLSCPEMIQNIKKWPAKATYDQITSKCFVRDEKYRASFTDLVKFITHILNDQEIKTYNEVSKLYSTKWSLLLDEPTRKRLHSSTKGDRRTIAESITSISDLC